MQLENGLSTLETHIIVQQLINLVYFLVYLLYGMNSFLIDCHGDLPGVTTPEYNHDKWDYYEKLWHEKAHYLGSVELFQVKRVCCQTHTWIPCEQYRFLCLKLSISTYPQISVSNYFGIKICLQHIWSAPTLVPFRFVSALQYPELYTNDEKTR